MRRDYPCSIRGPCASPPRPTTPCAPRSSWPRPTAARSRASSSRQAQGIPLKFLENILIDLRHAGIVRAQRGAEGGYWLGRARRRRSASATSSARSRARWPACAARRPRTVDYAGAAEHLQRVWIALRASLRAVLDDVTLADVVGGRAARRRVRRLTEAPDAWLAAERSPASAAHARRSRRSPSSSSSRRPRVICTQVRLAVAERELHADLEAEVDDPVDHRLLRAARRARAGCPRRAGGPAAVASSLTGPTKPITNSLAGLLVEVARRADLLDLAVVHHHDLLGHLHRLLLVVRDEDGRHVDLVVEAAQPGAQLLAHRGVERAERLVEQQHARLDGERAGEGHALALAAGELRRVAVRRSPRGARARAARRPSRRSRPSAACGS